MIWRNIVTFFF